MRSRARPLQRHDPAPATSLAPAATPATSQSCHVTILVPVPRHKSRPGTILQRHKSCPVAILVPVPRHKSCPGTILVPVPRHKSCPGAIQVPVPRHKSRPCNDQDRILLQGHVVDRRPRNDQFHLPIRINDPARPRSDRFPCNECNVPDLVTGPRRRQETS